MDTDVVIRAFTRPDAEAFAALNRHWLIVHQLLEPADEKQLDDPDTHVFGRGGEIFSAVLKGVTVWRCPACPPGPEGMEVAQLAVGPSAQSRGIGGQVLLAWLRFARASGFAAVMLMSNSALVSALKLYESV